MQHKVEICGVNTAKLKVLKSGEMQELLLRTKAGDMQAREELIAGNLRLVLSVIQRFANRGENADDLFQVGCIGLIKAIDSFDPGKGIRLSSYASKCIENEILMFFRSGKKSAQDVSINEPIDTDKDGNSLTIMDTMAVEDTIIDNIDVRMKSEKLYGFIDCALSKREKDIVCMRYGLLGHAAMPQRVVAKRLGISRSYVSRIEKKALEKLRAEFGEGEY